MNTIPLWLEFLVALLLLLSAASALAAAWGLARMPHFFLRMHPVALAHTGGAWSASLACVLYFSAQSGTLQLHAWIIVVLLVITAPITTVLLSRAALFRARTQGLRSEVPPALQPAELPAHENRSR